MDISSDLARKSDLKKPFSEIWFNTFPFNECILVTCIIGYNECIRNNSS